jgi:hypothetical protein
VTGSAGLTIDDGTGHHAAPTVVGGTRVVAWVVQPPVGKIHSARCRIETTAGRIDDRTIKIRVRQK